jgi:hypothetical protein
VASRLDLTCPSDLHYKTAMLSASIAACVVALKMQDAMSRFENEGLFVDLPNKTMKIRVGIHADSGYGAMTGKF